LVISSTVNASGPPFIALVSDNNPDLATYVGAIPAGATVTVMAETGALQDLTGPLAPPLFPPTGVAIDVQVVSAVPEPSTLALAALATVGLLAARRSFNWKQIHR
jgi:hypothetical protein